MIWKRRARRGYEPGAWQRSVLALLRGVLHLFLMSFLCGHVVRTAAQTASDGHSLQEHRANTAMSRPARDIRPEAKPLVSEEQVHGWVIDWQKRLRLEDWSVDCRIVRIWDLKPDTVGNVRWDREKKSAVIRVMNPVDYDLPASRIPGDMENTVVHELLHVQLCALPKDHASAKAEEAVVNRLTDALLEAFRTR